MKVTQAEIVDALNAYGAEMVKVGFEQAVSPTLPERIQQHGIAVDYVPMTDDEKSDFARSMVKETRSVNWLVDKIEAAVLARLGIEVGK